MAYFLKKTKRNDRLYLSIYESFYSPETKNTRHKSFRKIGFVDALIEQGIDDPISHFQKEVNELNSLYGNGETTGVGNQIYQWKGEQNTVLQMTAFSKNDEKATVILCVASFEYSIGS